MQYHFKFLFFEIEKVLNKITKRKKEQKNQTKFLPKCYCETTINSLRRQINKVMNRENGINKNFK